VYLTNVEGVCRRFCDDKRARLVSVGQSEGAEQHGPYARERWWSSGRLLSTDGSRAVWAHRCLRVLAGLTEFMR